MAEITKTQYEAYIEKVAIDAAAPMNPIGAFPQDARVYFDSLTSAQTAAAGAKEVGSAESKYYVGMLVTVVENGVVTHYTIAPDKTLKPIATKQYVDEELAKKQNNIPENTYDAFGSASEVKNYVDDNFTTLTKLGEELAKKQDNIPDNTYDAHGAAADVKDYADKTFATIANVNSAVQTLEGADNEARKYVDEELAKKQNIIPANTYDAYGAAEGVKTYVDQTYATLDKLSTELAKKQDNIPADTYDAHGAAASVKDYADKTFATITNVNDAIQTLETADSNARKYVDAELAKKQDNIPANTYDSYGSAASVMERVEREYTTLVENNLKADKTYVDTTFTTKQELADTREEILDEVAEHGVVTKGEATNAIVQANVKAQAIAEGAIALGTEHVKSIGELGDVQSTLAGSKAFRYTSRTSAGGFTYFTVQGEGVEYFEVGTECYIITNSDHPARVVYGIETVREGVIELCFKGDFAADPGIGWDKDAPYKKTIQIVGRPDLGDVEVGKYAFAQGLGNQALGYASVAMGRRNIVESAYGAAFGRNNEARFAAFVEGNGNKALGDASHAEGNSTRATANYAHSEGNDTKATKSSAHAEGYKTEANGSASHAQGAQTKAEGDYSDASGYGTIATATAQSVVGRFNTADNNAMFIVGTGADDLNRKNAFTVTNNSNVIVGPNSINPANKGSIAEGEGTYVGADYAHAAGLKTQALSKYSFAAGEGTKTMAKRQMAVGHYNAQDNDAYFIVGNGTSDEARSNVFTVRSDAAYMNGSKIVNETKLNSEVNTLNQIIIEKESTLNKTIADNKTTLEQAITDVAKEINTRAVLNKGTGINSVVQPINPDSTIYTVPNVAGNEGAVAFGMASQATGIGAFAQGHRSIAAGNFSHAEGDIDYESASYLEYLGMMPELSGLTTKSGAYGQASHSEGRNTVAVGNFSHAQNEGTVAYGLYSHAQNYCTKAMGVSSTAMGEDTRAEGVASLATGTRTEARADYSSAHGWRTTAKQPAQFVVGNHNADESTAKFIVGAGAEIEGDGAKFRNCFATGRDNGVNYIKVGDVKLTEAKLKKLLAFIETVDVTDPNGPKLITFHIQESGSSLIEYRHTYQAEEGMTLAEWCDSEYNIDGFTYKTNGWFQAPNGWGYADAANFNIFDAIVDGTTYNLVE